MSSDHERTEEEAGDVESRPEPKTWVVSGWTGRLTSVPSVLPTLSNPDQVSGPRIRVDGMTTLGDYPET